MLSLVEQILRSLISQTHCIVEQLNRQHLVVLEPLTKRVNTHVIHAVYNRPTHVTVASRADSRFVRTHQRTAALCVPLRGPPLLDENAIKEYASPQNVLRK